MQSSLRMLGILFLTGTAGLPVWVSSHDCLECLVLCLPLSPSWTRRQTPFSPPLPHQAMPSSHVRQQQQASYRQRCKSYFGDRAGQGFHFGVRYLVSLPNMMLVYGCSLSLPQHHRGNTATANPHQPAWHGQGGSRGKTPSHPQIPDPAPPPQPPAPHCLTCPPQREGDFAKRRWCLLVHPNGCPHLATAAASAPPSPGFLSCLWVWSKLDALKKLFMCVRVCVRVCVNHMIVIHLYPEQRLCTV